MYQFCRIIQFRRDPGRGHLQTTPGRVGYHSISVKKLHIFLTLEQGILRNDPAEKHLEK